MKPLPDPPKLIRLHTLAADADPGKDASLDTSPKGLWRALRPAVLSNPPLPVVISPPPEACSSPSARRRALRHVLMSSDNGTSAGDDLEEPPPTPGVALSRPLTSPPLPSADVNESLEDAELGALRQCD